MAAEEKTENTAVAPSSSGNDSGGGASKLQLLLTILNVVATLGMGAVLIISFQKEKHQPSVNDIVTHGAVGAQGEKSSGHGAEGADAKEATKQVAEFGKMVTLDQFTVNLSTAGSVNPKFVRLNLSIEVPTDDTENELNQKMPQVRNTVIDLINSKRSADLATPEGREYLKEEIRKALNDFLVTGKVKGVYFTNFAVSS